MNKLSKLIAAFLIFYCFAPRGSAQMYTVNVENGIIPVFVQHAKPECPFLLFIHGGPGYPAFPYLNSFEPIAKHFNLVFYEQRGTGKSYKAGKKGNGMNTSCFLNDMHAIVEWLKANYKIQKVFLLSHSWGSNIGIMYAKQHPENLWAYVGTGQSVKPVENERYCYRFVDSCALSNQNKKALKTLQKTDTLAYSLRDALKIRKWIYTYGGIVHANQTTKKYINSDILKEIRKCPQYSFGDKWNLVLHSKYSGKQLWEDMQNIDLKKTVQVLDVPVFFLLGRHDYLVSSKLAKNYFDALKAPAGKTLIWFEKSAHRPMTEEPEKFAETMIKLVLPLANKE